MEPTRVIGDCQLYLGDCRDILPHLPKVDAVITDPPYGISVDKEMASKSGSQYGKAAAPKGHYVATGWDDCAPDLEMLYEIVGAGNTAILWGGNYYGLEASSCWLVWDKKNGTNQFADCELAWTNLKKPVRKFEWMWNGMLRQGGEERNGHPTQKPLALMEWCIDQCPNPQTILDPFMGSGTTGVAAVQMGRKFIGIEREPKYFDIACSRIEQAYAQPDFFVAAVSKQQQESLL